MTWQRSGFAGATAYQIAKWSLPTYLVCPDNTKPVARLFGPNGFVSAMILFVSVISRMNSLSVKDIVV